MASLGWLLNLGFAGSGAGAAVGPFVGSLLLLGVGRMWWLPFVWQAATGTAYAGEIDGMVEYTSSAIYAAAGALAAYSVIRLRDYIRLHRKRKLWVAIEKERAVAAARRRNVAVGYTEGSVQPVLCANCGCTTDSFHVMLDGTNRCKRCLFDE